MREGEGGRGRRRRPRGRRARGRAAREVALRLDANGAWSVEEAVRAIDALAPAGLELVEEPAHGLHGVREVRERVAVRVAIDETAAEHGALGAGVADAVCLKISRCGGISSLIAAATLVRASGAEVYLASTLDGPLGIAAAIHAAAALASRGPVPPCGLATLRLFEDLEDPLPARGGQIAVPTAAGLGVDPLDRTPMTLIERHRLVERPCQRAGFSSGSTWPPATTNSVAFGSQVDQPLAERPKLLVALAHHDGHGHRRARPACPTAAPSRPCRGRAGPPRARRGGCGADPRARARRPRADPRRTAAGRASAR